MDKEKFLYIWTGRTKRIRLISDFLSVTLEGRKPLSNIYRLLGQKDCDQKSYIKPNYCLFARLTCKGLGVYTHLTYLFIITCDLLVIGGMKALELIIRVI